MTDKPTPKEIDDLVYELRQAGKDDTYSLASAVLAKWGTPAGAGEPFGYFHQLLNHEGKGNGVWLGAAERKVVEQAHTPGETSEEIVTLYTTPQPTSPQADSVQEDAARLDWLEQNLFHREKDEWDTKFGGYKEYNMWVLFSPKGIQGRARDIIDAARKQGETQ